MCIAWAFFLSRPAQPEPLREIRIERASRGSSIIFLDPEYKGRVPEHPGRIIEANDKRGSNPLAMAQGFHDFLALKDRLRNPRLDKPVDSIV